MADRQSAVLLRSPRELEINALVSPGPGYSPTMLAGLYLRLAYFNARKLVLLAGTAPTSVAYEATAALCLLKEINGAAPRNRTLIRGLQSPCNSIIRDRR
jgi:hypothetical protein